MRGVVSFGPISGITIVFSSGGIGQDLLPDPMFLERGLFLLAAMLISLYLLRERTR